MVLTEIEELRARIHALERQNQQKDDFLSLLAHELRNPLSAIKMAMQLAEREGPASRIEYSLGVVRRQLDQMTRVVDDTLDVARVMRGRMKLEREEVDLAHVMTRATESVQELLQRQRQTLAVSLPEARVRIVADPARLAQAITHLLHHAARYAPERGQVWLDARVDRGDVEIAVRDNGPGFPPEDLGHVFDLFPEGHTRSRRAPPGLGVGLALVKCLVELHGGTVAAESEIDRGSTFRICIPLEPKPGANPGPSQVAARPLKVLVVDDDADTAETLQMLLTSEGHEAMVARDGPSALEAVARAEPDAVLLDLGLPGMSGYEVAAQIRAREGTRQPFLVALSGYGHAEALAHAKEAGFDRHILKPPDVGKLSALLAGLGRT